MPHGSRSSSRHLPPGLRVLHEDRAILVVEKPAGMLTIATDRERERTAYFALTDYVRKGAVRSRERIFIVHRLDRETSGVLVFARTEEAKIRLQSQWNEVRKQYLAVVHGRMPAGEGEVVNLLAENNAHFVRPTADPALGKRAHTVWRVLRAGKAYSLLEIDLLTGRKHQIRVHLAGLGHPVVGDRKYGSPGQKQPRMALHAHRIEFDHPVTGERLIFAAPAPPFLLSLVPGWTSASAPGCDQSGPQTDT